MPSLSLNLSRVDRVSRSYDLATLFPELSGPFTAASVALLPVGAGPTAATVWRTASVASGVASVLFAGPDADSSGAVVVTGACDPWVQATSGVESQAVKVPGGRITLLGGGTAIAPGPLPQVLTVQGRTGAVVLDAEDVGATTPDDLAAGLATKVNSSTYTAGLASKQDVSTLGASVAADTTVRGAFAAYAATVQARWNARRQAAYERDNAHGFNVFVDFVNGNDANTGASPSQAWKTLGKLTTATIAYGSRIGLARGSSFSGNFTVPAPTGTGGPGNRVVFGAYGHGTAPTITGGTLTIQQPWIDVQDMRFTAAGSSYALFIFNATAGVMVGNQVKRCEFGPHTGSGGMIAGIIGGLVEDCYFHDVWNNVEYPSGTGAGTFFTTGTDGTEVRYNVVRNCYNGLMAGNVHRSLLIHHNIVDKCRVNGINMSGGGVAGFPPRIVSNFVWHRPTTPNGHGIDTQGSSVGPIWRNNIVYSDYTGAAGNVQLYCIDNTTYSSVDVDYNLGYKTPAASAVVDYGKLGATTYATLAAFQTALAGTSFAGKEAHSLSVDPQLADLAGGVFVPKPSSPVIDAGAVVAGAAETYLGTAPDLGAYEVA